MKHTKKILGTMLLTAMVVATTSCVDDSKLLFAVEKPASIEGMEYLNEYDVLKSYVNSSANPDFKLGIALAANDYIAGGVVTRLANSNFHEMTAGNAMKYSSIVGDDGAMNFETVDKFVTAAKAGGITIYGHTLAWHSQQNNKYLNGLIKDKEIEVDPNQKLEVEDKTTDFSTMTEFPFYVMGYKPDIVGGVLISNHPGEWYQYFVVDGISTVPGKEYKVTALIKSSKEGNFNVQMGNWGATSEKTIKVTTDWEEQSVTFNSLTTETSFVVFQPGGFDGQVEIKWVKVSHSEAPAVTIPVTVAEYDFEDGEPLAGWGDELTRNVENGVFVVTNPTAASDWQKQLCHETTTPFENGTTYFLKLKIKGSVAGSINAAFQNPDGYKGCGDFPAISVTTEWKEVTVRTTCNGDNALRMLFSVGHYAGTLYMDDISIYWEKPSNSLPLTPEEKKEVLTKAMGDWVKGMMETCDGYVTTWDVVNEAISGRDAGDGYYGLQSATRGTVSEEDAKNNFYWQDYLGDIDYVRTTIKFAREYYAEFGGNPSDLKLFINDYNLESDWDDNKKLKSLIKWIERWEEDGVTKVDGIGTQMHVSYHANPATQESKERHIVKMYELMAATGKLVKVSELDMGYVDENGNSVKTADMTEEQHKAMAEYYKFIVKKYFEIIPVAQQYGITQWCITDSPTDSGWRGGEPVGLWDLNYNRKPAYAGFADGLAGK